MCFANILFFILSLKNWIFIQIVEQKKNSIKMKPMQMLPPFKYLFKKFIKEKHLFISSVLKKRGEGGEERINFFFLKNKKDGINMY